MIQIGKGVVNATPSTAGREVVGFNRMTSPVILGTSKDEWFQDVKNKLLVSTKDGLWPVKPLEDFSQYYNSLIEHDYNLEENQKLNFVTNVVYLQSYLKQNNFDYRFINFDQLDFDLDFPILKQIDRNFQ